MDPPRPVGPFRDRPQTVDAADPASCPDSAEVSLALLVESTHKAGPKGPSQDVMAAVVDMKQPNLSWGCPRIAQQITLAFRIAIDKDVVRRILAARYDPTLDSTWPSWLVQRASHTCGAGRTPPAPSLDTTGARPNLQAYRWQPHCGGLYYTPRAA